MPFTYLDLSSIPIKHVPNTSPFLYFPRGKLLFKKDNIVIVTSLTFFEILSLLFMSKFL